MEKRLKHYTPPRADEEALRVDSPILQSGLPLLLDAVEDISIDSYTEFTDSWDAPIL